MTSTETVAYIRGGLGTHGGREIRLIEPDGSNDRLLWTVPDVELHEIADLDWKPDGEEIAFSSNHELDCSIYERDVYVVRRDGSSLRRLTNRPACAELAAYPKGAVTVNVQSFGVSGSFHAYIQGAPGAMQVDLAPGATGTVTFDEVADFGPGVWQQAVAAEGILRWITPVAGADVEPGASVHAGTLHVTSTGIQGFSALLPSWRSDGAVVGYTLGQCAALYQVPSDAPPGLEYQTPVLNVDPDDPAPGCVMDWGPTPALLNQFVYWDYGDGIYLATEESTERGELLVPTAAPAFLWGLRWLPDGSGFLYSTETDFSSINIYAYSFATGTTTQLTHFTNERALGFSASPDGQWIVFERSASQEDPSDLWIMRPDGSELRLLVEDGGSPAWSPPPSPLAASPTTLNFGTIQVGASAEQTLTLTNTSASETLSGSVGAVEAPFTIIGESGSFNLAPGEQHAVTIRYTPTATGSHAATLQITHSGAASPLSVTLTGTAAAGDVTVLRDFDPEGPQRLVFAERATPIDTGFVFGTNVFRDRAKAATFDFSGTASLTQVNVWFAYKQAGLSGQSYSLRLYDVDADGAPMGQAFFSESYDAAAISADEDPSTAESPTVHVPSTPPEVTGPFAVAIDFGDYGADDVTSVAIASTEPVGARVENIWEQWPDGSWHNVSDAWTGTYENDVPVVGSGTNGWYVWMEAHLSGAISAADAEHEAELPDAVALLGAYPNPFSASTTVRFSLARAGAVTLVVYNPLGAEVARLAEERPYAAGQHELVWNSDGLASGIYVCWLATGGVVRSTRLVLVR